MAEFSIIVDLLNVDYQLHNNLYRLDYIPLEENYTTKSYSKCCDMFRVCIYYIFLYIV